MVNVYNSETFIRELSPIVRRCLPDLVMLGYMRPRPGSHLGRRRRYVPSTRTEKLILEYCQAVNDYVNYFRAVDTTPSFTAVRIPPPERIPLVDAKYRHVQSSYPEELKAILDNHRLTDEGVVNSLDRLLKQIEKQVYDAEAVIARVAQGGATMVYEHSARDALNTVTHAVARKVGNLDLQLAIFSMYTPYYSNQIKRVRSITQELCLLVEHPPSPPKAVVPRILRLLYRDVDFHDEHAPRTAEEAAQEAMTECGADLPLTAMPFVVKLYQETLEWAKPKRRYLCFADVLADFVQRGLRRIQELESAFAEVQNELHKRLHFSREARLMDYKKIHAVSLALHDDIVRLGYDNLAAMSTELATWSVETEAMIGTLATEVDNLRVRDDIRDQALKRIQDCLLKLNHLTLCAPQPYPALYSSNYLLFNKAAEPFVHPTESGTEVFQQSRCSGRLTPEHFTLIAIALVFENKDL